MVIRWWMVRCEDVVLGSNEFLVDGECKEKVLGLGRSELLTSIYIYSNIRVSPPARSLEFSDGHDRKLDL